ncbi:GTP cyclohydrolase FolE2 [Undibacterium sp. TJN25]|uniref:GTP cyclohydrolase FolE2 n=1 Tax=Undibacterium sp. TJN25 TaxID=3413056 RepID=UPI003BEFFF45
MNAPDKLPLPDVQAQADIRNLGIDSVGVKGVRYPLTISSAERDMPSIANLTMSVSLPSHVKGTHMSRFLEILEAQTGALSQQGLMTMAHAMLDKLDASAGTIEMRFPYFVKKTAPVSGVSSLLDIDVTWRASIDQDGRQTVSLQVLVPATSLCPCSRDISDYGAHNQRSNIRIEVILEEKMAIEELIAIAENSASCEVYGLLKRADEKYVTERAYDNPKFVEDMVRDIALALNSHMSVGRYSIEVENFESIHNHSAFACISGAGGPPAAIQVAVS